MTEAQATRVKPTSSAGTGRTERQLLLIANGNASGLGGQRETLDRVAGLLEAAGGLVEAHVTTSIEELSLRRAQYLRQHAGPT